MEQWSELIARFSHVTDRLGKPIDPGILEGVVALNMLGIQTSQSCEGHLDRGLAYPWIDLALPPLLRQADPPDIQTLQFQLRDLRIQAEQQETPQIQALRQEARQADLQQRYSVHLLLAKFYHDRQVPFDQMITFSLRARIRSQGGEFLALLPPDERAQKLREYQTEMAAFTDFLKLRIEPERMK